MTRWLLACALVAAAAGPVWAQAEEADRFYLDKDDEDLGKTLFQGALTSSTFYFAESGTRSVAGGSGLGPVDNASPFSRLFTDLRAQLDARHLKGGRWDGRLDTRLRYVKNPFGDTEQLGSDVNSVQSGAFGDNEYELRELYLVRGGRRTDLFLGRQVIADLGAIKIDGLRIDYAKNKRWTYLGFAGLYPKRGSRSIKTDYPIVIDQNSLPTGSHVMPVTGGFGGAYRTQRTYGAIGAVAIAPTSRDGGPGGSGTYEQPRLYVVANGYWRRSSKLDLYHYVIFDLYGSGGQALTNGSVGLQWKPKPRLRVHVSANTVDADALNVQVRDQLADAGPFEGAVINNLKVQRIAARSARAGITGGFGKLSRFELSAALSGRRRPEVVLEAGAVDQILPAAQAIELQLQAVDRKSWKGIRLDASYIRSVGVGAASYARSRAQIVRVAGTRELKGGKAELAGDVALVSTADDNAGMTCNLGQVSSCWGSANTRSLQANGLGYYRFQRDWYVNGSVGLGTQKLTITSPGTGVGVPQTSTLLGNFYLRLGYRF